MSLTLNEDDKKWLLQAIADIVDHNVARSHHEMIEQIVRAEIEKFMQRFMFVIATPKKE